MHSMNHVSNREGQNDKRHSRTSVVKDQSRINLRGDVYSMNAAGQITSFRFSDTEVTFSFSYNETNELSAISSSAGWTWTKTSTEGFRGWVVRNYFDLWQVSEDASGSVYVNQTGIHATGKQAELMALPAVVGS